MSRSVVSSPHLTSFSEHCLQVGVSESLQLQLILSSRSRGFKEQCDSSLRRMIAQFWVSFHTPPSQHQLGSLHFMSRCLLPWPPALSRSPAPTKSLLLPPLRSNSSSSFWSPHAHPDLTNPSGSSHHYYNQ
uniref:Uncharacterized protein n=1 Tax=Nothobranchius rachovii TaxID=451742 RepID=A0A1A8QMN7_9TELE